MVYLMTLDAEAAQRKLYLDRLKQWKQNGFFCIPGFLGQPHLRRLRVICDTVLEQARSQAGAPGMPNEPERASIGSLTDPKYFHAALPALVSLLEFIAGEGVLAHLNGLGPGRPLFHDTQYFHEQTERDWDGAWHRDSQFEAPDPVIERQRIRGHIGLHFRVAFEPDDRLEYVAGTHARWDTAGETAIRKGNEPNSALMPNGTRIALQPGDACVFHAWGIHRGTYRRSPRRTLDIVYGFGPSDAPPVPTCFRSPAVLEALSPPARDFFQNFINAYSKRWLAGG
jgi:Phytanoyl-CoA dioxygenase (PhyH)